MSPPLPAGVDALISFCFVQEGDIAAEIEALVSFAAACDTRLKYWEALYVVNEGRRETIEAAASRLAQVRNLRILFTNRDVTFYRARVISASEAIGDVVVLSSFGELPLLDLVGLAEEALKSGNTLIAQGTAPAFSPAHWLLDVVSPYRIDPRDLKTVIFPRARLTAVLARPTATVDLRFQPKRGAGRYVRRAFNSAPARRVGMHHFELLAEIISTSAPRFLKSYALISLLVFFLAGLYAVYAVAVYILRDDVQPGWFSASLVQSGSVGYIALGFTIVSLGVARIVEQSGGATDRAIVDEIGNINFFTQANRLNIEAHDDDEDRSQ